MQIWEKEVAATQQVDVLLFEAFSAHCLANTVEPLRAANTYAGQQAYAWRFLTLDGKPPRHVILGHGGHGPPTAGWRIAAATC